MQEAPHIRVSNWYWLAAVCLLFVFMLPLVLINKKKQGVVKTNTVQTKENIKLHFQPNDITSATPSMRQPVVTKQVVKFHSQRKKQDANLKASGPGSTVEISLVKPTVLPVMQNFIPPLNRDTVLMASLPLAKKKLRVVHINELEQPLRENIQAGSKQATAAFQIQGSRLFQAGDFEFGGNSSPEILKIKLPPLN